jgi:hypothetical protein
VAVFLDQALHVQPLVTGEEQEAVGVRAHRFVGADRNRHPLVAVGVGALADELDRGRVELFGELVDSLVDLAQDAPVDAHAPLALAHGRQPTRAPLGPGPEEQAVAEDREVRLNRS